MNMKALGIAVLIASVLVPFGPVQAQQIFYNGFESYPGNANIHGQPAGATTWKATGVVAGDQAKISTIDPANGSSQCLFLADNGGNAPKATINFVIGGFIPSPLNKGSIAFYLREDPSDGGADDLFRINAGEFVLIRNPSDRLYFANNQGGTNKTLYFTGNHTYTPGEWNRFEIVFDNDLKQADLYINDDLAGSISGTTQDYSISSITLGAYSSTSVSDAIYFDDVEVLASGYFNDFENYSFGTNISLLPSNTGTGAWTTTGVLAGDQAIVSNAYSMDGDSQSILLADNGGNVPSARLSFVDTGLIPAAAAQGEISFSVKEDPADGSTDDGYFVTLGSTASTGITLTRDVTRQSFLLTVSGPSTYYVQFPSTTESYSYAADQWNTFRLRFDNIAKTADLYINDAYAGSQMLPVGADPTAIDFSVDRIRLTGSRSGSSYTGDKVYYDNIGADFGPPPIIAPWRSALYPANWTPGFSDAQGRTLQDFSYAGYRSGTAPVPHITGPIYNAVTGYGADPTGVADSTTAIQNTINAAKTAGGGVVYLPGGTYRVAPIGTNLAALSITSGNIVLRGDGPSETFLFNSNPVMKNKQVISVKLPTEMNWYTGGTPVNLTANVALGDKVVPVASTTTFAVGDLIVIRNDLTQAFIDEIGNTGLSGWTVPGANYPRRMLAFCRRVEAKTATTLTLDVPLRYGVKTTDNGRVFKVSAPMLQEIGLEDLSIGMQETTGSLGDNDWNVPGTGGYNADHATAIFISGAENCWITRVNSYKPSGNATYHTLSNGISIDKSRFITMDSCDFRQAQYHGANGNGYHYTIAAQETLVLDSRAETGRHNLSIDHMYSCGNVFLRLYLKDSSRDSDFHQFLSMSNLLDSTICDGEMIETRLRTEVSNPAPGWTSTESVFWNTTGLRYADHDTQGSINTKGLRIIQSYQRGHGYVIGTQGPAYAVTTTNFAEGIGKGAQLVPSSLYLDQRLRRLGY